MALGHGGKAVEKCREVCMLAGLDKAEMALRQRQRLVAWHRADDRNV